MPLTRNNGVERVIVERVSENWEMFNTSERPYLVKVDLN